MGFYVRWLFIFFIGYLLIGTILPVSYVDGRQPWMGIIVIVTYIIGFSLPMVFIARSKLKRAIMTNRSSISTNKLNYLIFLSIVFSIVGTFSLLVDRIYFQGVDYSEGFAAVREQLREEEGESAGPSSIFSVLGYFLMGMKFWAAYLLIRFYEQLGNNRNKLIILVSFFVLVDSVIIGGRTILLYYFAFIFSIFTLRLLRGLKVIPLDRNFRRLLKVGLLTSALFVVFVFMQRASMNNVLPMKYAESFTYHLGGMPNEKLYEIAEDDLAAQYYFLTVTGMYIYHSSWTTQSVLESRFQEGQVLFIYFGKILFKLGLIDEHPKYYEHSGRFITLPGAIYHDFGLVGLFNGLLIHILLIGLFYVSLLRFQIINEGFFVTLLAVTALLFFHPATEFLVFPFTLSSLFLVQLIKWII